MFSKSMRECENVPLVGVENAWGDAICLFACTPPQSEAISICTTAFYSASENATECSVHFRLLLSATFPLFAFFHCLCQIDGATFRKTSANGNETEWYARSWQMHAKMVQYVTCQQTHRAFVVSHLSNENIYLVSSFGFNGTRSWQNISRV